ncbi:hypothetical protein [Sinorhizobium saheli]|uniref:Uncharacterized protein n=1 Tax=Sinorhizobium saheli TaxID=36856 RepID=A0A178XX30_SINSA|nr:hypothetical protein [Sinorhizobium saheli]MQW86382.1 hypothetical protein [Sinorhizobium saheli]OAP39684.1 hypothetical protein ATB98_05035 [Sinorhizobium saheli]
MSASLIFDLAPIGSLVSWSDNTPRPPDRFRNKLAAWETRNSQGRLIRKEGPRKLGSYTAPGSFTLHEGDIVGRTTILVTIRRTFGLDSDLSFKVIARPPVGSIRIFDRPGETRELLHLAENRQAAEAWLKAHRYPSAVLDEVGADEAAADPVEGRTAP